VDLASNLVDLRLSAGTQWHDAGVTARSIALLIAAAIG